MTGMTRLEIAFVQNQIVNSVFNTLAEGIITVDPTDTIVSVNAAVKTIFGYKPKELVGCSIDKVIARSPATIHNSRSLNTVTSGDQPKELEGLHKKGAAIPLELSTTELKIKNIRYMTYIFRDISLRKNRELQERSHREGLAQVNRHASMIEIASAIAHEINQPLAAISIYAKVSSNLINAEKPDLIKLAEILSKTEEQALRAGQDIHRIKKFVKCQSKHLLATDINTLIYKAVDLCADDIKQNGITLKLDLTGKLPQLDIDQVQIELVLINLIRNSVDALKNMAVIWPRQLSIQSHLIEKNIIQVSVKDSGLGLNDDQQKHILMPFHKSKASGMSMGLSISRALIEEHGGTLGFKSEQNKGSTFYFRLPLEKIPASINRYTPGHPMPR